MAVSCTANGLHAYHIEILFSIRLNNIQLHRKIFHLPLSLHIIFEFSIRILYAFNHFHNS